MLLALLIVPATVYFELDAADLNSINAQNSGIFDGLTPIAALSFSLGGWATWVSLTF